VRFDLPILPMTHVKETEWEMNAHQHSRKPTSLLSVSCSDLLIHQRWDRQSSRPALDQLSNSSSRLFFILDVRAHSTPRTNHTTPHHTMLVRTDLPLPLSFSYTHWHIGTRGKAETNEVGFGKEKRSHRHDGRKRKRSGRKEEKIEG
jgi:hypothetical protein